ncbi:hypothetical protein [Brachybacterium phenoliresistens]|uniref:Lipoprotein n=2 Tax=Brachybacterium phenoliresistens TaxID=396014 RepID=Z9JX84_9MICO|nr:hypothetical protein BF93_06860 [Brachybacterium phenoliresistens]
MACAVRAVRAARVVASCAASAVLVALPACSMPAEERTVAACPGYVAYDSPADRAAASDLVARATVRAPGSPSEDGELIAHVEEVVRGEAELLGAELEIDLNGECGDTPSSVLPADFDPEDPMIVFLVGSQETAWRLLTPVDGVMPYDPAIADELEQP